MYKVQQLHCSRDTAKACSQVLPRAKSRRYNQDWFPELSHPNRPLEAMPLQLKSKARQEVDVKQWVKYVLYLVLYGQNSTGFHPTLKCLGKN